MDVLQAENNVEWQLRYRDMLGYIKVQDSNMTLEEKNTSCSQYNYTCKFANDIHRMIYHNVKNMSAGGNKMNFIFFSLAFV